MKVTKYKARKINKGDVDENLIEDIIKAAKDEDVLLLNETFDKLRSDMKVGELRVFEEGATMFFVYKEKQKTVLFGDNVKCVFNGNAGGIMDIRIRKFELCAASVMAYF